MSNETVTCQYKEHQVNPTRLYRYWDEHHGISGKGIEICYECYAEHILKHYPESKIAQHIKANPADYKNFQD